MDDLRIENLRDEENLSVRSYNVLRQNGFFFLSQILDYYKQQAAFTNFRNCGLKSQDELTFLCKKYENYFENGSGKDAESLKHLNSEVWSIKIKDINSIVRLKKSTRLFLKENGFVFFEDVFNHYERYRSFMTLPLSTKGINNELIFFIKKIKSTYNNLKELPETNDLLSSLNLAQFTLLELWFKNEYQFLRVRSRNVIENLIGENVGLKSFYQTIIINGTDISSIRNAGVKTIGDISRFIEKLKDQLKFVKPIEVRIDTNYIAFAKTVSISKNLSYEQLLNYEPHFFNKRFPLFEIFDKFFLTSVNFNTTKLKILKYFISKDFEQLQLNDIANASGYSTERIRQLKIKLIPEALSFFEFDSTTAELIIANTCYVSSFGDCIHLNQIRKYYFEEEIIAIQDIIVYKAIGKLFNNSHSLFLHETDNSTFAFLISNEVMKLFDFKGFANDIEQKLEEKKLDDEFLNFEGYIFPFIREFESNKFERIKIVAESIVENGYALSISFDGNIIFPKNANKTLPDLILEVLRKLGKPSHLNEILTEMQLLFPDRQFLESSVRSNIFRVPDLICFSRTSTYGLKEWEEEKGIRGGTIREIVEEFLQKFNEPKHILEVEEHVLKFRDTNEKNIITNLKLDIDGRFVIFPGSNVGLSYKDYDITKIQFKKLPKDAPKLLKSYLKNKKMSEEEIEAKAIKVFKIDTYQARYWLRQHKSKGTFSKNIIPK